jgi:Protein of unknown function (DUF1353)
MPFVNQHLKVSSSDGRNFTLLEPLEYIAIDETHYQAITLTQTDGCSTPPALWIHFPPFGKYWFSAILHDAAYRSTLSKQLPDGSWLRIQLTESEADNLINEAMQSQGVNDADRLIIFNALKAFGATAYSEDLAKPIA